ncbi:MAG: Uma2 family endonuclease [Candidatus Brocadia sp.]|jgi:Uma2 family endonuclease
MKVLLEKKVYTYDDINSLPEGNYEIIDGEMVSVMPAGFRHGEFECMLSEVLRKHLGSKGYVAVGEVGIIITKKPFRLRAADVIYLSKETSPQKPVGMLETPPDLIIEIISEENTAREINDKVRDYLSIGVKRVILIDPFTEIVTVYHHGRREAGYYSFDEEFELVAGVSVKLKDLY